MGEWPPLRDALQGAPAPTSQDRTFRGDVRSANWDGGGDLSGGKDTDATQGYLIDYSSGSAQFQDVYADGGAIGTLNITGTLTMGSGGLIRTASSGARVEIKGSSTTSGVYMYTGYASEDIAPIIWGGEGLLASGATTFLSMHSGRATAVSGDNSRITLFSRNTAGDAGSIALKSESVDVSIGTSPSTLTVTIDSQGINTIDGAAATPPQSFAADLDTGAYRITTNTYGIAANGTEMFRVDDPNNGVFVQNGCLAVGVVPTALTTGYIYNAPPTTATAANATWVLASGTTYYLNRSTSSRRYKSQIEPANMTDVPLRGVRFWSDTDEQWQYGLIAEEVAAALPEASVVDGDGLVDNFDDRAVLAWCVQNINDLKEA